MLLIDEKGEQLGEMPTEEAMKIASDRELDLVEVAPGARPPVCRLLNYGKFKYEATRKERESRRVNKSRSNNQLREVRMKTRIGEHDRNSKTRLVRILLEQGSKVKDSVIFRGREMQHPQIGMELLKLVAEDLIEDAMLDKAPGFEGRFLSMILSPNTSSKQRMNKKELDGAKA